MIILARSSESIFNPMLDTGIIWFAGAHGSINYLFGNIQDMRVKAKLILYYYFRFYYYYTCNIWFAGAPGAPPSGAARVATPTLVEEQRYN